MIKINNNRVKRATLVINRNEIKTRLENLKNKLQVSQ